MKKRSLPILILLGAMSFWSCNDQCKETRVTRRFTAVTRSLMEIRTQVKSEAARALEQPGKMYIKGDFLFINEIKKGIHIIDNSNPASPKFVSFIGIPGNGDIAIRDNILYADSYSDLVAIDISDITHPSEAGRVKDVFQYGEFEGASWSLNVANGLINDNDVDYVTEVITTNCEDNVSPGGWWGPVFAIRDFVSFSSASSSAGSSSGSGSGQAGSMARFALYSKYLYTVGPSDMRLFDVSKPAEPKDFTKINLGWGIETIFPYGNRLYIGSNTGMHIYDNTNPAAPQKLGVFQHGRACDPVVVHENIAYVTIRTGNSCQGTQNQLDLVDVSKPESPQLIKSYQMQNPHGLSINFPSLYLCEGASGLKVFDVKNKFEVDKNLISHFKGMDAYDVISLGKTLLLIGKDGFYQYDATNQKDLRLLSKIPVGKAI
jgi:hypothetical protein